MGVEALIRSAFRPRDRTREVMPKLWMVSDDVRSQMAVAAIDARVHIELAIEAVKPPAGKAPSQKSKEVGSYLSHARGMLISLEDLIRHKVTPVNGGGAGGTP